MKKVTLSELKLANYNPASRSKSIGTLKTSMEEHGLFYPILVDKDNNVIEGHRRIAAAKLLGWEAIPAIVCSGDRHVIYAEVNNTGRRMTGAECLSVWMKEPSAVSARHQRNFEGFKEQYGIATLRKLVKAKKGIVILRIASEVSSYVGEESSTFARKTVDWIMKHRMQSVVRGYMSMTMPPKTLLSAIRRDRPLRAKITS